MPVTLWDEIPKGQKCENCKINYATHFYGSALICCECHAGPGEGLVSNEEAKQYHESEE